MPRLFRCLSLPASLIISTFTSIAIAQSSDSFEAYPDKADMMIVVAHPDDESTFGGLIPNYAVCHDKKIVFVCLTSGEWGNGLPHHANASDTPDYSYDDSDYPRFEKIPSDALYPCYYRELELAKVLMMMGVKTRPIMPRFTDKSNLQPWGSPDAAFDFWGGEEKVVGFVVSQIRRFKPDVVVSMARNGYNGNPQHAAASRSAVLASEVAGNPEKFKDQLHEFSAWQPKKVYLHVGPGESYDIVHSHSWDLACKGDEGRARILAARANVLHESQEMKEECESSTDFVLLQSAVGPDIVDKDDLFENIR